MPTVWWAHATTAPLRGPGGNHTTADSSTTEPSTPVDRYFMVNPPDGRGSSDTTWPGLPAAAVAGGVWLADAPKAAPSAINAARHAAASRYDTLNPSPPPSRLPVARSRGGFHDLRIVRIAALAPQEDGPTDGADGREDEPLDGVGQVRAVARRG